MMKALSVLLAAAALLASPAVAQQSAPKPLTAAAPAAAPAPAHADPSLDLTPAAPGQILPPPVTSEPGLIPDAPAEFLRNKDKLAKAAVVAKTKTEIAEEALLTKVRYRQAHTRALADPALAPEYLNAHTAKTEYAKRQYWKHYYNLLFDRILKIDPRIAVAVEFKRKLMLHRLTQTRMTPTIPLPQDKPLAVYTTPIAPMGKGKTPAAAPVTTTATTPPLSDEPFEEGNEWGNDKIKLGAGMFSPAYGVPF